MASDAFIKDLSNKLSPSDIAKLTARVILKETLDVAKEMAADRGNDPDTRGACLLAQTDADELISQAQDGIYQMMTEEFFDEVSNEMVKLAKEYVK